MIELSFRKPDAPRLPSAADLVFEDHKGINSAIVARDPERAAEEMLHHLSRIVGIVGQIRRETPGIFAGDRL
jgi:DNA-binding FadR family transcriptional regulator